MSCWQTERRSLPVRICAEADLASLTLIDVIHFGLGSEPRQGESVLVEPLKGLDFLRSKCIQLNHSIVAVSKGYSIPKNGQIRRPFRGWLIKPKYDKKQN